MHLTSQRSAEEHQRGRVHKKQKRKVPWSKFGGRPICDTVTPKLLLSLPNSQSSAPELYKALLSITSPEVPSLSVARFPGKPPPEAGS